MNTRVAPGRTAQPPSTAPCSPALAVTRIASLPPLLMSGAKKSASPVRGRASPRTVVRSSRTTTAPFTGSPIGWLSALSGRIISHSATSVRPRGTRTVTWAPGATVRGAASPTASRTGATSRLVKRRRGCRTTKYHAAPSARASTSGSRRHPRRRGAGRAAGAGPAGTAGGCVTRAPRREGSDSVNRKDTIERAGPLGRLGRGTGRDRLRFGRRCRTRRGLRAQYGEIGRLDRYAHGAAHAVARSEHGGVARDPAGRVGDPHLAPSAERIVAQPEGVSRRQRAAAVHAVRVVHHGHGETMPGPVDHHRREAHDPSG